MKDNNSNHPEHATSLSPAARLVFDKALTRQLLGKLVAFAKPHQTKLAKAGMAWLSADDLVQTAIVKTLDGTRKWDHEKTALADHLKDVIDSRVSIELKHARKFPELHIEAEEDRDAMEAEVARAMAQLHSSANAMRAWKQAAAALENAAQRDVGVRRVLEAYAAGARTRREVMALSKMTKLGYAAAYARLKRLCAPSRVSSEPSK
jgi:hypothetical protein